MGKLLFWIFLVIVVLFAARIAGRMAAAKQAGAQGGRATRGRASQPRQVESMVRCAHCGIHLPRSEALLQGGQTWCNAEHARLGPGKH
ncbi:hypothetical protein JL37_21230 [Achromobacter sp. RTa]|uniref:PP0621 family protein n=1 Tax=Achromobacter sp. RTa TaxID=1532557 RepID=UPI00050DD1F1|nr:PP0621 family protein [Achromobacter sp. RTa]KGD90464.1 hypothetical protein JL37_21230 [Achromobacter sp. RTa]